jgi:hypothetical protein
MELHREMAAADLGAALSDRDLFELRAAAGAEAAGIGGGGGNGKEKDQDKPAVRAATIDNFQARGGHTLSGLRA